MNRIVFASEAGDTQGTLFRPQGTGLAGAIIVVHEWWGLNTDIEMWAERFSELGYLALAIDLYDGKKTTKAEVALELASELKTADAMKRISAGVDTLRREPRSNQRVAVTGFCLGGAMALAAAFQVDGLAAAVPFYGNPRAEFVDFSKKLPPILGHYAKTDPFVDAARTQGIAEGIVTAGGSFELHLYDASHAFMREGDPQVYSESNAKVAWERTRSFLSTHLSNESA